MGYTSFTKELVRRIIKEYNPKSVLDLGSQQDYDQPLLPAPYISSWFEDKGIDYTCIDLNGENNAIQIDLGNPPGDIRMSGTFQLIVDAGTQEHIGRDGHFEWEAIYNCWKVKTVLCEKGGIIISENPKSGHWPLHGYQWFTDAFYRQLETTSGLKILEIGEVCAMGNCETGKNIYCVMQKHSDTFPHLDLFKTFSLKQS